MPEVRIRDCDAGLFNRSYRQKADAALFDQILEIRIRQNRCAMSARLQRKGQTDDRMHVAGTADRWKQDIE